VIKSRVQASHQETSITRTIAQIHSQSGSKGFFHGFTPTMARAFPANAITFFAFETVRFILENKL